MELKENSRQHIVNATFTALIKKRVVKAAVEEARFFKRRTRLRYACAMIKTSQRRASVDEEDENKHKGNQDTGMK